MIQSPPLSKQDLLNEYLKTHIPGLLQLTDWLEVIYFLEGGIQKQFSENLKREVFIEISGFDRFRLSSHFLLTKPVYERAVLSCRIALDFFGIKRDRKKNELYKRSPNQKKSDDVFVEDFFDSDIARILGPEILNTLPYQKEPRLKEALINTIFYADKLVAHLALQGNEKIHYTDFRLCSRVVKHLFEHHFYRPLSEIGKANMNNFPAFFYSKLFKTFSPLEQPYH